MGLKYVNSIEKTNKGDVIIRTTTSKEYHATRVLGTQKYILIDGKEGKPISVRTTIYSLVDMLQLVEVIEEIINVYGGK